jgi:peptidoglycan/LPS O-acetylase OafA/YrhL
MQKIQPWLKRQQFDCLTGIRGFAALWIILSHQFNRLEAMYPDQGALLKLINVGWLGVDIFSLLSGFIISYAYCQQLSKPTVPVIGRFLWLRFARTWPLHLFVLVLFMASLVNLKDFSVIENLWRDPQFLSQLFLVQGWGFNSYKSWNVPSWTLSAEWFWYLLFPLFSITIVQVHRAATALFMAFACISITGFLLIQVLDTSFATTHKWGVVRIGGEMFAGCFLYRAYQLGLPERFPYAWVGVAVIVLVLLNPDLPIDIGVTLIIMAFLLLVLGLAMNQQPFRILFGNRASIYLGDLSYSLYMNHWLFVGSEGLFGYIQFTTIYTVIAVNAAIIGMSVLTYHFVERPSRAWLRGFVKPTNSSSTQPTGKSADK